VVEKRNTKKTNFYVFRYIPTEEWLSSNMDLSTYSGEIQVFDFQTGSLLGSTNVINGNNSTPENKVITCKFTMTGAFICTAGICEYEWILECTDDGDGGCGGCGNPFPYPPNPGDGDPTQPGSGTAPILGDGEDEPIIVECLQNQAPNMFGECDCIDGFVEDGDGNCVGIPCSGDPLADMQILGTLNNGIPGGGMVMQGVIIMMESILRHPSVLQYLQQKLVLSQMHLFKIIGSMVIIMLGIDCILIQI